MNIEATVRDWRVALRKLQSEALNKTGRFALTDAIGTMDNRRAQVITEAEGLIKTLESLGPHLGAVLAG